MDPKKKLMDAFFGPGDHRTVRDLRIERRLAPGSLSKFFTAKPTEPPWDRIKAQLDDLEAHCSYEDLAKATWLGNEIRRYLARVPSGLGLKFEAPCLVENLDDTMRVLSDWGPVLSNWWDWDLELELDAFVTGPLALAQAALYEGLLLATPGIETPSWVMPEWFHTDRHTWDAGNWAGGLQVIAFRRCGDREGWVARPMEFEVVEGFEPKE
jgi:hypothetical protein